MTGKNTKRAFTMVELIIVISVIAILAAILIPTFSNVIKKANAAAALSDARNTLEAFLMGNVDDYGVRLSLHAVIFIEKANQYYIYGYVYGTNPGESQLVQSARNPYKKSSNSRTMEEFITNYNLAWSEYTGYCDYVAANSMTGDEFQQALNATGKLFCLSPNGALKSKSMETVNTSFNNITERIPDVPAGAVIMDGVVIGDVVTVTTEGEGGEEATTSDNSHAIFFNPGEAGAQVEDMPQPARVIPGGTFSTNTVPAWAGHRFAGWFDGDTQVTFPLNNVIKDVFLTAHWETASAPRLAFRADGATINLAEGLENLATDFPTGTDVSSYISNTTAEMTDGTFAGWARNDSTFYWHGEDIGAVPLDADITLDAVWEIAHSLTYDLNGATDPAVQNTTAMAGAEIILPNAPATTPAGKPVFAGWKCSVDGVTYGALGEYRMANKDVAFTAQWNAGYTVSFCDFDGSEISKTAITPGGSVTLAAAPERTGHTFTGWIANDGTQTLYNAAAPYTVNADVIFTAQYSANPCTVTYDLTDGVGTLTDTNNPYTYGSTVYTLQPGEGVIRPTGKQFKHWNSLENGTGTVYGESFTIQGDTTLYAVWEDIPLPGINIIFDAEGASNIPTTISGITEGQNVTLPATRPMFIPETANMSVNTARSFTCWVDNGGNRYFTGDTVSNVTQNITLTAEWVADCYAIRTAADLEGVSDMAAKYVLAANITLESAHTPLGKSGETVTAFTGLLDGNGFTISGFAANCPTENYVGLVARNGVGGTIKYVNVSATGNVAATRYAGGIAGSNLGMISHCAFYSPSYAIVASEDTLQGYAGGIAGYNNTDATIEYCTSGVSEVSAKNTAGGVAGANLGTIRKCLAYGGVNSVYADAVTVMPYGEITRSVTCNYAGGIAGTNIGGTITGCQVRNDAIGIYGTFYVGGIVGSSESNGQISNCVVLQNGADIGGVALVGGIAGAANSANITGCHVHDADFSNTSLQVAGKAIFANGYYTITTLGGEQFAGAFVGGITGYIGNGTISCCSARAEIETNFRDVSGENKCGAVAGLAGYCDTSAVIDQCWARTVVNPELYGGDVSSTNWPYVGGVAGVNRGQINYCWANAAITGGSMCGGFCGANYGTVTKCWSKVEGYTIAAAGDSTYGDFISESVKGTLEACYYEYTSDRGVGIRVESLVGSGTQGALGTTYFAYSGDSRPMLVNNPDTAYSITLN